MAGKIQTSGQTVYSFPTGRAMWNFVRKHWALYLLSVPGILYFLVFKYIPLFGSVIAFQNYNIFKGITGSPWVGLENFRRMFEYHEFVNILRNTILIGLYDLIFAFPVPIILALLLNCYSPLYILKNKIRSYPLLTVLTRYQNPIKSMCVSV